jgi:hypothetical protein
MQGARRIIAQRTTESPGVARPCYDLERSARHAIMNVQRTAAIVLGGGALAAWLAGAATSMREPPNTFSTPRAPIDARGAALANEITKLRERLRPSAMPRDAGRNLFQFQGRTSAAEPAVAAAAPPVLVEAPPPPVQPSLKLAGIGEDESADGVSRMAFISTGGQLFVVKEGDTVTPRYRVTRISADVVELADLSNDTTRRLVLR